MSKQKARPLWKGKGSQKESSEAASGSSSQGNRSRKRSRSPSSESEDDDDDEEVDDVAQSRRRSEVSRRVSIVGGGMAQKAASGSDNPEKEDSPQKDTEESQEAEDKEESTESGKDTPEEILENNDMLWEPEGEYTGVTVAVADQEGDAEQEGASSAADVNSNLKGKEPSETVAGSKSGRELSGGGAPQSDLRKKLRNTKKLRSTAELEQVLDDETSDYECRGDKKGWTKARKKNTRTRWNRRREILPSPPPLHELEGNRELVAEFEAYARDMYKKKETAQTATTNLFRRSEGNSLLHYMASDAKHGPSFKLERLVAFNKYKGYLPPVGAKEWINHALPGREDFDASLQ